MAWRTMDALARCRQEALKFEAEVREDGRLELSVPFTPGDRVTVFVVREQAESFDDLLAAAQSTTDFWDNPYDDEDWNDA
jgi:hypothetical protein